MLAKSCVVYNTYSSHVCGGMSLLPRANLLSSADGRNNFNDVLMYQSRDHNSRKKTIIVIQLSFLHCKCLVLIGYVKMFNHLISIKKAGNTTLLLTQNSFFSVVIIVICVRYRTFHQNCCNYIKLL
jgi:hypothetical protein